MSRTLELAKSLVARPSITPNDAGCQELLINHLAACDFKIERMKFHDVDNLWARWGNSGPLFAFVGHTDVVPTGPLEKWHTAPFEPTIRDGYLYGRGAADMKGSIAAMVVAIENFLQKHQDFSGSIALLITSDEEGPSIHGTKRVIEVLNARNETIDWCLVGEPSCDLSFGDTLKIGRRGSLSGKLTILGKQGHIAYPQKANNAIHCSLPILDELRKVIWDQGNDFFQPTSFQFSNIHAGTGVGNVIPGELTAQFNLRFSTELTAKQLQEQIQSLLNKHAIQYNIEWTYSGNPFITPKGTLLEKCAPIIKKITGITPHCNTAGGTSDGRFIAPTGSQVIEFGPCNATIHQINECVSVNELDQLTVIYEELLKELFLDKY